MKSFNGAATLSLRRLACANLYPHQNDLGLASMGPQLYRCGDTSYRCVPHRVMRYHCFNGAATLSLRRRPAACARSPPGTQTTLLQWGRNFIVAETSNRLVCTVGRLSLLQWGRNFIVAETLSWCGVAPPGVPVLASMGPQLYRCGDARAYVIKEAKSGYSLQWGRNFIVAETRQSRAAVNARLILPASMGPQLYRCGDRVVCCFFPLIMWTVASMGPQLYRCGDSALPNLTKSFRRFHASMGPQLYRCGDDGMPNRSSMDYMACFNGAATLSLRRRGSGAQNTLISISPASMGPQLYRCGDMELSPPCNSNQGCASMGPQLYRCGDQAHSLFTAIANNRRFNGAATLSLRRPTVKGSVRRSVLTMLQWGRNFIVAETRIHGSRCNKNHASMGPQLYRCGDATGITAKMTVHPNRRFNGAATLSLRRQEFRAERHLSR